MSSSFKGFVFCGTFPALPAPKSIPTVSLFNENKTLHWMLEKLSGANTKTTHYTLMSLYSHLAFHCISSRGHFEMPSRVSRICLAAQPLKYSRSLVVPISKS